MATESATVEAGRLAARPAPLWLPAPRALLRRRPTLAAELLVVACWVASAWWLTRGAAPMGLEALPQWTVMAAAMMLPGALPAVRHVAENSFRWRRGRAMATFVATYLATWTLAGAALLAVAAVAPSESFALTAALACAAGWQVTGAKRRALWACHRTAPLPPRGWPATRGLLRFGAINGSACVRSCWALMAAMTVAAGAHLVWMLALTALSAGEKLAERPRALTRHSATWLAVAAVVSAILAAA